MHDSVVVGGRGMSEGAGKRRGVGPQQMLRPSLLYGVSPLNTRNTKK